MNNLLWAGVRRYLRSPVWWLTFAAAIISGIYCGNKMNWDQNVESLHFLFPMFLCAILLSLLIGREFSDGVLRNKVVAGHKKGTVFLSEMILGLAASACLILVFFLAFVIICGGCKPLSRIPGAVSFSLSLGFFLLYLAFAALNVVISMLIPNKAIVSIVNLLLVLVLLFVGDSIQSDLNQPKYRNYMYDEETGSIIYDIPGKHYNPNYIDGTKRKVYEFILALLPGGQIVEFEDIMQDYCQSDDIPTLSEEQLRTLETYPRYSVGLIAFLTTAGWLVFRRRDMK